jgi:hypothetical protein
VYPFLADKIPDGIDVKKINADEHEEMEETLRDLESADCEKPEPFYAIVKSLTAILNRHRCDTKHCYTEHRTISSKFLSSHGSFSAQVFCLLVYALHHWCATYSSILFLLNVSSMACMIDSQ